MTHDAFYASLDDRETVRTALAAAASWTEAVRLLGGGQSSHCYPRLREAAQGHGLSVRDVIVGLSAIPDFHPSPLDVGWAAGVVDGEGSIYPCRPKNPTVGISVTNTERAMCDRMARLFGGSVTSAPPRRPGYMTTYVWRRGDIPGVVGICRVLYPHLTCPSKQGRAGIVAYRWPHPLVSGRRTPDDVRAERRRLGFEMFRLQSGNKGAHGRCLWATYATSTVVGTLPERPSAPTRGAVTVDGPRLRRFREDHGLALVDLARKAGVSKGYLSKIERRQAGDVSPPVYARLAGVLGLAVADLRPPNQQVASS